MKTTKQFTKSNSAHYNKTMQISKKEHLLIQQATLKYQKFKKSASLPSYYLNQARLKKITEIYRTLSSDKINIHSSKSRRNSPSHTPQKHNNLHVAVFKPINVNSLDFNSKQKTKLTIQRGGETTSKAPQSGNSSWAQLTIKLRSIANHFEDIYNIKSQEMFMAELDKYLENYRAKNEGRNREHSGQQELNNCLRIFSECLSRRQQIRISNVRREYADVSQQLSNLQVELKKKAIRAVLDQKQIEKAQKNNYQLEEQLRQIKKSLAKQVKDIGCGTQSKDNEFTRSNDYNKTQNIFANTQILTLTAESAPYIRKNCTCNEELQRKNIKLAECMHKMHSYAKRNKQFLSVLVVLQREGIDIQKIYDDVINGRVSSVEEEQTKMVDSVEKMRRSENKVYRKYRAMKASNEFDADQSIISSADGLSFNYDEKSLQEDVYTVRRQYKCKKQMNLQLKDRLKLNFDVLYDEQLYEDDYQSQIEQEVDNPPTI